MRRRTRRESVAVPERLARFAPIDWPGSDPFAALAEWKRQRRAWAAQHPGSLLGDLVDQLRAEIRARHALYGWDETP